MGIRGSHRLRSVLVAVLLCTGAVAGCGGENSNTQCSMSSCTVTFDRGVDAAQVSLLGVQAELVGVQDQRATLEVAGQRVTVPVGDSAQAGDFTVTVQDVTSDRVVVEVSLGGGG